MTRYTRELVASRVIDSVVPLAGFLAPKLTEGYSWKLTSSSDGASKGILSVKSASSAFGLVPSE